MAWLANLQFALYWVLALALFAVELVALVDAARRPAGAFVAAFKRTKTFWVALLAVMAVLGSSPCRSPDGARLVRHDARRGARRHLPHGRPAQPAPRAGGSGDVRAVVQRVHHAGSAWPGNSFGEITRPGLVALVGITHHDDAATAAAMARKIADLRILRDELSCVDAGAPVMVISQFTLYGDTRKGRRPGWTRAARARWRNRWWTPSPRGCGPAGSRWRPDGSAP
jgi:D-Tyr-tRNAtyr deacylase